MLALAKNFAYLEIMLLMGWAAYFLCLSTQSKKEVGHFPLIVLSSFYLCLFFLPLFLLIHIALLLLPLLLARTRGQLLTVMIVGCLGIPTLSFSLTTGGIYLFDWPTHATLGLGGLMALATTRRDPRSESTHRNVSVIIFLVLMIFIALRGTSSTNWLRQTAAVLLTYGIPVFVIGNCLRSPADRRTLLSTLTGMGSMLAVVLTYEARAHWPLFVSLYNKFDISLPGLVAKFRGGAMRAYGPLDESTAAGFALVIAFAAALACGQDFRRGPARYAIPALMMLGVLAPQSRGGVLGMATVILCYAFYRYGTAGLLKAVAVLVPFATAYLVRNSYKAGQLTDTQVTVDYRQQLFARGVQEFWKHPIAGDTMSNVSNRLIDLKQGEGIIDFVNSYLYFALATGFVGLLAFCFVMFYPPATLFLRRRKWVRDPSTIAFGAFAFGALMAASVMLVFTSIPTRPMIIVLAIAGAALALRAPMARPTTAVKPRRPEPRGAPEAV
ncbi:O-antigen ligase family protein [Sphingomonas sp. TREG-RG-20F-R18-01]|uniref:O-antigen ligase family protein n=1 Tax=Sphingomonas sp. TREG-RG-20F-R18-01 TaxID=2914982 RepID=UPI001F5A8E09|nr:O-antigen ligase family protein [Sphingomonas sp. TREG-RG-20F-R18-01]